MGNQNHKNKRGRPLVIDETVLAKLEDAFSNGFPDKEACLYAGIDPATLYRYQERHPEFSERKEALKLHPNMAARQTIVKSLNNVPVAQWWLTKKAPDEFGDKSKIELGGKVQTENIGESAEVKKAVEAFEQTMRAVLTKAKA